MHYYCSFLLGHFTRSARYLHEHYCRHIGTTKKRLIMSLKRKAPPEELSVKYGTGALGMSWWSTPPVTKSTS